MKIISITAWGGILVGLDTEGKLWEYIRGKGGWQLLDLK
jgi:hypothetical protein